MAFIAEKEKLKLGDKVIQLRSECELAQKEREDMREQLSRVSIELGSQVVRNDKLAEMNRNCVSLLEKLKNAL